MLRLLTSLSNQVQIGTLWTMRGEGATATRPSAPASVSFTAEWLTTKKPTVQNAATRTTQRGRRPERLQTRCAMRVGGPVDERNMLQR